MSDPRKWMIVAASLIIGGDVYSLILDLAEHKSILSETLGIISMVLLIIVMVASLKQNPDL